MTKPVQQRRKFIKHTAALSAAAATGTLGFPAIVRGQSGPLKIGILHPVTGPLAYSGQQCRDGALMAIDDDQRGRRHQVAGRREDRADAAATRSRKPQVGAAEIEKMNEAGASAVVGAYASAICLATTQAAAKHNLPHVVDVGVADQIVERGLKNTFRFGPGYKICAEIAMNNLHILNTRRRQAGEDGDDHPRGVAVRHRHGQPAGAASCRGFGFEVDGGRSSTPTRRATSTTSCCA